MPWNLVAMELGRYGTWAEIARQQHSTTRCRPKETTDLAGTAAAWHKRLNFGKMTTEPHRLWAILAWV